MGTEQGSKCGDPDHRYAEVPIEIAPISLKLKVQVASPDHFTDFSPGQINSDISQGVKGTNYVYSPVDSEQ